MSTTFDAPLRIEDLPVPEPGPGQIVVKIGDLRVVPHRHSCRARRLAGDRVAVQLGAEYTVNAAREDPVEAIQVLGGADAAIALAAAPKPFEQAFRCLRRNGRLVFVGLPAENKISLPIFEMVLQGITVTGSIVGTRVDLAETYELHADGRTKVIRETRRLDQVNDAMGEVLAGTVPARLVFDLR